MLLKCGSTTCPSNINALFKREVMWPTLIYNLWQFEVLTCWGFCRLEGERDQLNSQNQDLGERVSQKEADQQSLKTELQTLQRYSMCIMVTFGMSKNLGFLWWRFYIEVDELIWFYLHKFICWMVCTVLKLFKHNKKFAVIIIDKWILCCKFFAHWWRRISPFMY